MPTYRLDLAYDGTDFHGYARQPGVRTVQEDLETALMPYIGETETFVAGRTDKGVHAVGQVVSFSTEGLLDHERVLRSLNRRLGPEIGVTSLAPVDDGFHARFSATGRSYRYSVRTAEAPDPFRARFMWHYGRDLELGPMNVAAAHFVGERDFASLCRKARGAGTVRMVRTAAWREVEPGVLHFRVTASSFCHQMVRSMVAVCVDVGRGKLAVTDVPPMLAALDRRASRGAAPPHGLTLVSVEYGGTGS